MTITNGYCSLAELKVNLDIAAVTTYDTNLENLIENVSRWIDNYTNRKFYATTASKYYTAQTPRRVKIDELLTITTLKTDEDLDGVYEALWTANDFKLFPYNDTPYTYIEITPYGNKAFYPGLPRSIEVTGSFGYASTTPEDIERVCILQSSRTWARRTTPLGIAGTTQFGLVKLIGDVDPDVMLMLRPYIKYT